MQEGINHLYAKLIEYLLANFGDKTTFKSVTKFSLINQLKRLIYCLSQIKFFQKILMVNSDYNAKKQVKILPKNRFMKKIYM